MHARLVTVVVYGQRCLSRCSIPFKFSHTLTAHQHEIAGKDPRAQPCYQEQDKLQSQDQKAHPNQRVLVPADQYDVLLLHNPGNNNQQAAWIAVYMASHRSLFATGVAGQALNQMGPLTARCTFRQELPRCQNATYSHLAAKPCEGEKTPAECQRSIAMEAVPRANPKSTISTAQSIAAIGTNMYVN